jgi:Histidine kinase-, DNA gyrase B-, and HSP90-like ATPase
MVRRKLKQTLWMIPAAGALVFALVQPPAALAAETRGGNDITVGPAETIDDDLYAFGQNMTILGTVTGSVIAGGNTVAVNGEVGGDVMAAGSTVIVDGPVHGSVRAAGRSVQVRSSIDGDLLAAGNSVSVLGDGRIGRDLLGAGTTLTIAGPVGRDVNASGDQVRISSSVGGQVDSNATNAVKYSPPDRVQVQLTVSREQDAHGEWATVDVEDHGIGIPAADLPHFFERFHRGTNVSDRLPGTGLGLAGAREIVAQHDGELSVQSQEGQGSIFTLRVPLTEPGSDVSA